MKLSNPPTILMVTHVVPFPPSAGNEIRILNLVKWLKRKGFRIVLLLKTDKLNPGIRESLNEIFHKVHLIGDFRLHELFKLIVGKVFPWRKDKNRPVSAKESLAPDSLIQMTKMLCNKYHPFAVIAEYIFTAPCLDVVPQGTLKIIDTHDMFSRKKALVNSFGIDDPFCCTEAEERAYLLKSDLIMAIQTKEAEIFKGLVPEKEVITVGIDFDVVSGVDNSLVVPGTVLVVGSDNPLNVHGLNEFLRHAWPVVCRRFPEARLRILGKVGNHVTSEDCSIQKVGWVADLNEEYRKAEIVINPTIAGTGLKIKSVEALCWAKPLIGTPNSVDGLPIEGETPFFVARDWSEFSEKILELLVGANARYSLQLRAWEYSKENLYPEKVYTPLARALQIKQGNCTENA
jgi:glycosyltransferase involved in cell wall biosynthesis